MKLSSLMNRSIGVLLALALSALAWNELRFRSIAASTREQQSAVRSIVLLKDLRFHVVQIQQFLTDVSATHDDGGFEEALSHRDAALAAATALAEGDPAYSQDASQIATDIGILHSVGVQMAQAYEKDGLAAGNAVMKKSGDGFDDRSATLASKLEALDGRVQQQLLLANRSSSSQTLWVRMSGIAVVIILVGGMAILMGMLRKRVLPPLQRLQEGLEAMRRSRGATVKIEALGVDFEAVAASFNAIIEQLAMTAQRTQSRAEDICLGTQRLTGRASDQAARYEETAASMEEMTAAVKSNAQNAIEATRLASDARASAEQGTKVVREVVGAIEQINHSSRSIAEIIGLIDEIAFQTNLLALNAAVEAARAGEQGRGFAVVAGEVRTLAGRSAEAAKQIKALINESVAKVEQGSRLAADSGRSLASIVAAVDRVATVIASINTASNEQAQEIDNVNRALVEIDGLTQENARLFSQAASAAEALIAELRGDAGPMNAPAAASGELSPVAKAA